MKAHYVERGIGRVRTGAFILHETENPVTQERIEETIFGNTPFLPPERPKPKLASSN